MNEDQESHRQQEDAHSQRTALLALFICLALVLGGLFLVYKLKKMSELQDCLMQGRTNCEPIDSANPAG